MDALMSCKMAVQWIRSRNSFSAKIHTQRLAVDQACLEKVNIEKESEQKPKADFPFKPRSKQPAQKKKIGSK